MAKRSGKISACNLNLRTKVEKFSLQNEPYAKNVCDMEIIRDLFSLA
jgi:hypothetical protein